jgi:hypothetical protein
MNLLSIPKFRIYLTIRDGQSVSSSEEDDDEILEGEGTVGLGAFSRQERERATTVFHYCATGVRMQQS